MGHSLRQKQVAIVKNNSWRTAKKKFGQIVVCCKILEFVKEDTSIILSIRRVILWLFFPSLFHLLVDRNLEAVSILSNRAMRCLGIWEFFQGLVRKKK